MTVSVEKDQRRLESLIGITERMMGAADPDELVREIIDSARRLFEAEACSIALIDERRQQLVFAYVGGGAEIENLRMELGQGIVGYVAKTGESVICRDAAKDPRHFGGVDSKTGFQTRSLLCAPLTRRGQIIGAIETVNMSRADQLSDEDLRILGVLGGLAGNAIDRVRLLYSARKTNAAYQGSEQDRHQLIVGTSAAMHAVVELAKTVAASNSTVLLLGESGTGKEVLARAIHRWSPRAANPFVAVNCVALSPDLIESELFGHEKGAFTGAFERKLGKFELAEGGTIFLDEVGELSLPLQTKLLRVLQDKEFQRVGGSRDIFADVRILAATNRDLSQAILSGAFRKDLYYRLNVVSLTLPPLGRRREDIPALAEHFAGRYCREVKRPKLEIDPAAMELLVAHAWLGNVRELQNALERAVVLSPGPVIMARDLPAEIQGLISGQPAADTLLPGSDAVIPLAEALDQCKRTLIRRALEKTGGNQSEAARLLGLQRPNLSRLMKSLSLR